MFRPSVFWCSVLAVYVAATTSQVLVRKVNEREGSVCFLADGRRGVCKKECGGQVGYNQNEYVCNPDSDQPLNCCGYDLDNKYPTLQEGEKSCYNEFTICDKFEAGPDDILNYSPIKNSFSPRFAPTKEIFSLKNDPYIGENTKTYIKNVRSCKPVLIVALTLVCRDRRLTEEFIVKGVDVTRKLGNIFRAAVNGHKEHNESVKKWCNDTALEKDEEERGYYLHKCQNVPQPNEISIFFGSIERKYYLPEVMVLGWNSSVNWACPGVLVHPSFILTSAECLMEIRKQDPDSELKPDIILGGKIEEREIESYFDYDHGLYKTRYIFIHPDNRIALLEAQITTDTKKNIFSRPLPICLWTERNVPQDIVSAVGFWDTSDEKQIIGDFVIGNASLLQAEECENPNNLSQICAHTKFYGKESCGDVSGGYLQVVDDNWLRVPYLVGIASPLSTCNAEEITEYVSIYPYLEWIENIISAKYQRK